MWRPIFTYNHTRVYTNTVSRGTNEEEEEKEKKREEGKEEHARESSNQTRERLLCGGKENAMVKVRKRDCQTKKEQTKVDRSRQKPVSA